MFAPHHYLSSKLNYAADCWVLKWGNEKVGFCAILPQPTGTANYCKRVSRLVILPDFQGLGAGTRFLDAMCKMYTDKGYKMYIRSAHIKLANYWQKSPQWRATARCGKKGAVSKGKINGTNQNPLVINRPCYSYEYVGDDFATKPHLEIAVDSLDRIDVDAMRSFLVELKGKNYLTIVHNKVQNDSWLNAMCRELGIRTELLFIHGKVSKKRKGMKKLVELHDPRKPIYGKV